MSCPKVYEWLDLVRGQVLPSSPTKISSYYDYGIKRNILRMLVERGCKVGAASAGLKTRWH